MDSKDIAIALKAEHFGIHKKVKRVGDFLNSKKSCQESLYWISDKYLSYIENPAKLKGTYIVSNKTEGIETQIIHKSPRKIFSQALELLHPDHKLEVSGNNLQIDSTVRYNDSLRVGQNVVIKKGCVIGENVMIGDNSILESNCVIGNNVVIGKNTIIGGEGFGFEKNSNGEYSKVAHIGSVTIEDNVFIGDCVTIARGTILNTRIDTGVKIDNQVHIAHNCLINDNSIVTAGVTLSGGVILGKNCWVGPNAAIYQKVKITDNCIIGIGSVVLKDCKNSGTYFGVPVKKV